MRAPCTKWKSITTHHLRESQQIPTVGPTRECINIEKKIGMATNELHIEAQTKSGKMMVSLLRHIQRQITMPINVIPRLTDTKTFPVMMYCYNDFFNYGVLALSDDNGSQHMKIINLYLVTTCT